MRCLRRRPGAVQFLALDCAAKAPIEPTIEREVAPGRHPLHALRNLVGRDLVVVRGGVLHGHAAINEKTVACVIKVSQIAEQLVLGKFVHRPDGVLMDGERVLTKGGRAQRDHAVGDLDHRQPAAGQQGRKRRIGSVGDRDRRHVRRRWLRGSRRRPALDRLVGESEKAQRVPVRFNGGEENFAALRRADFPHAMRGFGPA